MSHILVLQTHLRVSAQSAGGARLLTTHGAPMPLASLSVHPVPSLAGSWVLKHLRRCATLSLGEPSFGDLKSSPGCSLAQGLLGLFTWPFSCLSSAEFLLQGTDPSVPPPEPLIHSVSNSWHLPKPPSHLCSPLPSLSPSPLPVEHPTSQALAEQQGTNTGTLLPSERGWWLCLMGVIHLHHCNDRSH